ncbi:hypothetical protein AGMMS4956_18350 [Bacteroidia bacterium]|nr:hypothetical protein AGMMS4956_18350 [Bacteroidia bacterium]
MQYIGEIITFLLTSLGGGVAWFWSKKKTRTEKARDNYTVVQEAINPLLDSIHVLTERNSELAKQLVSAHERSLNYFNEIITLKGKVQELTVQVNTLTREIQKFKIINNETK